MNFNRKRSLCVIAFVLAINFAVISGQTVDNDLPRKTDVTTEKEFKTTFVEDDESTTDKTKISLKPSTSSSTSTSTSITVKSTTAELPLGDEPAKEPNSPPEVAQSSAPPKESTTVPPLIHNTETSPGTLVITSSSTTTTAVPSVTMPSVVHVHDNTTPSTTTKKPNSATGLHVVQFYCFVASAMLVLLR